jgi:hypothetical protein
LGAALQADGETRSVVTASSIRRRSAAWTILPEWTVEETSVCILDDAGKIMIPGSPAGRHHTPHVGFDGTEFRWTRGGSHDRSMKTVQDQTR